MNYRDDKKLKRQVTIDMNKKVEFKNSDKSADSQDDKGNRVKMLAELNSRPWTYMVNLFCLFVVYQT